MEILFFQSLPIILIVPLILKRKKIPIRGNNQSLLLFRCFLSILNNIAYYYTLTIMTVTDAISIKQLCPFIIIILASIFLKEKIIPKQISVLILAFLGALLIIKPQLHLDIFPVIIGLIGSALSAGTVVSLRYLRSTDHPLVIVNYFGYTLGGASFLVLLWQGNFLTPELRSIFVLILLGIFGLIMQITFTHAFQLVPARLISPCLYLQIIFGTIFSLLIFKEIPDMLSMCGAVIILISGYLNYRVNNLSFF
jgi:drug/metabolite transporter (DMT)-like permease